MCKTVVLFYQKLTFYVYSDFEKPIVGKLLEMCKSKVKEFIHNTWVYSDLRLVFLSVYLKKVVPNLCRFYMFFSLIILVII